MKNSLSMFNHPPKLANRFLIWALPDHLVEPVLGDLFEEFQQRISSASMIEAKFWYWLQAMKSGLHFMLKTQRGFVMFIFSVLLFLGLIILAMVLGGDVGMFVNIPSVLIVFPPAIAFTYAATSGAAVKQAFALLFSGHVGEEEQIYEVSKRVFSVLGNSSVLLGFFMTLLGWIAMASNIDDMRAFGPALAVSLLTLLYGMGIKVICYVAEQKIQTLSEG